MELAAGEAILVDLSKAEQNFIKLPGYGFICLDSTASRNVKPAIAPGCKIEISSKQCQTNLEWFCSFPDTVEELNLLSRRRIRRNVHADGRDLSAIAARREGYTTSKKDCLAALHCKEVPKPLLSDQQDPTNILWKE